MKIDVSILIVNYNTSKLTLQCVDSIIKNTSGLCYEIIVIDNNSKHEDKAILLNNPNIKFIELNENIGFGRANNIGFDYSKGDFIFLLNPDTIILNNAIKDLHQASLLIGEACCGALLVGDNNEPIHSYGQFPTLKSFFLQFIRSYLPFIKKKIIYPKQISKVDYITGADLLIPRTVIEKYGFFNPQFFMYYEETELQYRYTSFGVFSYIIPKIHIKHLEGKSIKLKLERLIRVWEGSIIYSKIVFSITEYLIFRLLLALFNLPKIVIIPSKINIKIKALKTLFYWE